MSEEVLKLEGHIYDARCFKWVLEKKMFFANISDVPRALGDLCHADMTLGFGVRSYKTGRIVYFVLESAVMNDFSQTESWLFSADNAYNSHPQTRSMADLRVTIHNNLL